MQMVECPGCGRKFRVAGPVVRQQMTCSRCGASFVGSSVAAPDPAPAAPPPGAGPAPRPRPIAPRRSGAGPVMLIVCILGVLGIAALGVVALLRHSGVLGPHTIVTRKGAAQPPAAGPRRGQPPRRTADGTGDPTRRTPSPPRSTPTAGEDPVAAPEPPKGEAMLDVGCEVVTGGAIGEDTFVAGRVRNRYPHPLDSVTVVAWVRGMEGPSRTVRHVPAGGQVLYSMRLASGRKLSDEDVRVVATSVKAADGVLIWQVPDKDLERAQDGGKYVWRGRTRNPHNTAVSDVRIVIDYFDADGIQYGTVTGKLADDQRTLGAGKTAWFRAATDDFKVGGARKVAARAVAKRY